MAFSEVYYFLRLADVFVFWQSETVVQTKRKQFIMFYATKYSRIFGVILAAFLVQGFLRQECNYGNVIGCGTQFPAVSFLFMTVDFLNFSLRSNNMNLGTILFEKAGQAPSPSKDFHQLLVTESQVILRTWRISVRKDQRYIPPSQRKVPSEEFDEDTQIQTEISRIFGENTLRLVHGIVCKDWLARLPKNILIRIATFLDLVDIARLGSVCRSLHKVCSSDDLWEKIFITHCDTITEETRALAQEVGWKKVFFTNKLQLQVQMRRRKERHSAELKKKSVPEEEKIPQTFVTQPNGHGQ